MNERFFLLPLERQKTILDAAMKIFARHDYRKASAGDIAQEAGISKALLFHYFDTKKGLYAFVYRTAVELFMRELKAQRDETETDFFRIIAGAQKAKMNILAQHPDLMQFILRAYYETDPEVHCCSDAEFCRILPESTAQLLQRSDHSKFKPGISAEQACQIVVWMSEGFMQYRTAEALANPAALNDEFMEYLAILQSVFYREETV